MLKLRVLFFLIVVTWGTVFCGDACGEQTSDDLLADQLTSELVCLPRRDNRPLKETCHKLFAGADQSRLLKLADRADMNVAMWARWELRRTPFGRTFDASDRFYPVRFLELKGIEVPSAWAKEFAAQFLSTDVARGQSVEYYRKHTLAPAKMSFIGTEPRTYIQYSRADVPTGTTVCESQADLLIKQAGRMVRLGKPLTKNFYGMNVLIRSEDVFLPLLMEERTFILNLRGSHMMPFELTCFGTRSGKQNWETVGWSGIPEKVDVVPRILLPSSFDAILLRTIVGEVSYRDPHTDSGRGGTGQFSGGCSLYLTANDRLVTVFGSEGILFVEAFDVKTGRNVLRFATDYNGDDAGAAEGK
jgi:hypothetical protein